LCIKLVLIKMCLKLVLIKLCIKLVLIKLCIKLVLIKLCIKLVLIKEVKFRVLDSKWETFLCIQNCDFINYRTKNTTLLLSESVITYTAGRSDKAVTIKKNLPWPFRSNGQEKRCLKGYQTYSLFLDSFWPGGQVLESRSRRVLSGVYFQQSESARWEWSLRRMGNWLPHF
jgi:hypothetical protein